MGRPMWTIYNDGIWCDPIGVPLADQSEMRLIPENEEIVIKNHPSKKDVFEYYANSGFYWVWAILMMLCMFIAIIQLF